jgi:hypothetical protein
MQKVARDDSTGVDSFSHGFRSKGGDSPGGLSLMFSRKKYPFLFQPLVVSFISSLTFFVIVFVFFRPGYAANDDISIISLASGYLGGKPLPFLVYSNVVLGFILNPLYGMSPTINWEVLLFIALNFFSVWALVYTFLSHFPAASLKWLAIVSVLLCDVSFVINITYTMIAAFSSIAGFCLVFTAIQFPLTSKKGMFICGVALALAGSLIRLKAMLLIAVLILPALIWFYHSTRLKQQLLALTALCILVLSGYLFDRFYLQSFPDWNSYQIYDSARSQLHDTPREINIGNTFAQIGWSKNDYKEFFNWFFPDKQMYSLENLQYLVEHVSDKQESKISTLATLVSRLLSLAALPYLLIVFFTWFVILFYGGAKRTIFSLAILLITSFTLGFYFIWAMKFPDRILLSLLAGTSILGLSILMWSGFNSDALTYPPKWKLSLPVNIAIITLAFGLVLNQSIETTKINIRKQAAYQNILVDVEKLQYDGKISKKALIISLAYGLPLEWANPFTLNFPKVQILEMGWLTFSPAYEQVLRTFDAQSIPEAFYEKENVYLMAPHTSLSGILDFIKEHKNIDVNVTLIYKIPETDIGLYQLRMP